MVTICIGPVCVPLHLLLPFLVGLMHRYGWFKWFKQEWVTIRYWKSWWKGATPQSAESQAKPDVKKADDAVNSAAANLHNKDAVGPSDKLSKGTSNHNTADSKAVNATRQDNSAVNPDLQHQQSGHQNLQHRTQGQIRQQTAPMR